MKTRVRLGRDGGLSVLVDAQADSDTDTRKPSNSIIPVRSKKDGATKSSPANGEVSGSGISLSEDESDQPRQKCVSLMQPKERLGREKDAAMPVVVEFPGRFLPHFNGVVQEGLRGGIAHATCVRCQLQEVVETKKASKQFDAAKGREFYHGTIRMNEDLRSDLRAGLQQILGYDLTVLVRDGHATYLFARVVQRSVKNGALLWTTRFAHDSENSRPNIRFSRHEDGHFFKSSLRPNDDDG
ncbi:hypothetical protein LTR74_018644 [Friedmanniomyces endolithicus]|nr:hypothetical protein LTR74_018644 [Friedmanniomyces endolithicus]